MTMRSAYMPVKPNGDWWIAGCDETPSETFHTVEAREGCVTWKECEAAGWKVVHVYISTKMEPE